MFSRVWLVRLYLLATSAYFQAITADNVTDEALFELENKSKDDDVKYFTGYNGAKITNIINSLSVGKYGPILLTDNIFLEKIGHLNRERIPERRVSARGNGAFGFFKCTNDGLSDITEASLFSEKGKKTKIAVRFGLVTSRIGSAETRRDAVTMAVKFYTDKGNWDLLMDTFPVFAIRDPIRYPDLIHAFNADPKNNLENLNMRFDYISLVPETLPRITYLYSDRGIPDGWRHMDAYSPNTFKFVNKKRDYIYVRFMVESQQGTKTLTDEKAAELRGTTPDYSSRDLYDSIKNGDYPKWTLKAQLLDPSKVEKLKFNPFDVTKSWDPNMFPYMTLGEIELDKNPSNWFSQVEQMAFNPASLPPGIQYTLDKVLQGMLFIYRDAQNYRLGVNHYKLAVNKPIVPINQPTIRDGFCADWENGGSDPNYYPNSYGETRDSMKDTELPILIPADEEIRRFNTMDDDNYSEANKIWRSFDKKEQWRVVRRMATDLVEVKDFIVDRFAKQIKRINENYYNKLMDAMEDEKRNPMNRFTNYTHLLIK
ncbi:catalase-like [Brevipalpus obovatus]|uniref:catalase-like n=1 Tax=Brevipalpus obovatus TaxID=246614 RepID=UPI003D9EC9C2